MDQPVSVIWLCFGYEQRDKGQEQRESKTMSTQFSQYERELLEQIAGRRVKPTRQQKAAALLNSARGVSLEANAEQTGITQVELATLLKLFDEQGLAGLGLIPPTKGARETPGRFPPATIESTPGVCGGSARVSGTRIPVWVLVEARDQGVSEAQLLLDYPTLTALNLVDAWKYAENHREEIVAEIHQNEVA